MLLNKKYSLTPNYENQVRSDVTSEVIRGHFLAETLKKIRLTSETLLEHLGIRGHLRLSEVIFYLNLQSHCSLAICISAGFSRIWDCFLKQLKMQLFV